MFGDLLTRETSFLFEKRKEAELYRAPECLEEDVASEHEIEPFGLAAEENPFEETLNWKPYCPIPEGAQ
jgi:hypothetical protein